MIMVLQELMRNTGLMRLFEDLFAQVQLQARSWLASWLASCSTKPTPVGIKRSEQFTVSPENVWLFLVCGPLSTRL